MSHNFPNIRPAQCGALPPFSALGFSLRVVVRGPVPSQRTITHNSRSFSGGDTDWRVYGF
jgi:hypothetical protein